VNVGLALLGGWAALLVLLGILLWIVSRPSDPD
jgi:hypothetical protein